MKKLKFSEKWVRQAAEDEDKYLGNHAGPLAMNPKVLCPFCNNTGEHLSPEVAEPIVVPCEHKDCPVRKK